MFFFHLFNSKLFIFIGSGNGFQNLKSNDLMENSHIQHFGDLKPQEEGGIRISIKYEVRNSDRNHEPTLIQDGVSDYFDYNMLDSESNPYILSQKEKKENDSHIEAELFIQLRSDNASLIKNGTADELVKIRFDSSSNNSVTEKKEESENLTTISLAPIFQIPVESTLADTRAQETDDGKGITVVSDSVTVSFLSNTDSDVEQNATSVNYVRMPDVTDAAEENPINSEQSKERPDSALSENIAISGLVNSLHRQKRFSPQINGRRTFIYKNRNR